MSFAGAALRETHEEVGVPLEQIEILGQVGPSELSLGGLRVHPFVVRHIRLTSRHAIIPNAGTGIRACQRSRAEGDCLLRTR